MQIHKRKLYYPVVEWVLEYLTDIACYSSSQVARACALEIFCELSGYTPQRGDIVHNSKRELEKKVASKYAQLNREIHYLLELGNLDADSQKLARNLLRLTSESK